MGWLRDKKWQVFLLVAISIFMSTLDSSIVNVALPQIMQDLQTDMATIQWVVVYLLTVSALLLTFGRLSDIKGRRVVYVLGFLVFTIGSLLCGLSHTPGFLIFSRAIQGVGASMLMACAPALVADVFKAGTRGKALGMIGAVVAAGLTTGPVAGGILLAYGPWPTIFLINVPIGIAATLGGILVLKDIPGVKGINEPMDKIGSLLLVLMLSLLIIGLTRSSDWGVVSVRFLTCIGLSALAGFLFRFHTRQNSYPLFDFGLLKIRRFILPVTASCILFAALFVIVFMMPFYLTYPKSFSASQTGTVMIVPFLFLMVVSPLAGYLADRIGSRVLCLAGMVFLGGSLFSLTFLSQSMTLENILWRVALSGIGTALFVSPNNTTILGAVPDSRRGIASGAVATARNLGMVLGVALAGAIFTHTYGQMSRGAGLDQYTPAMAGIFMESFRRTMIAGLFLAVAGAAVTFARGKEPQFGG